MSLAVSTPRVLSTEELADYITGIKRDFVIARTHQRNAKYELVVTPKSYVVRTNENASIRADLDGFTCSLSKSLIKLYQQNCPDDMEVKAIVEKKLPAPYDKQQKDVYMLRVRFTLKRPATKGRRRFF